MSSSFFGIDSISLNIKHIKCIIEGADLKRGIL